MTATEELKDRIARLPAWAREHIKHLEARPEVLAEEVVSLRREVSRLQGVVSRQRDQNNAMVDMFRCAARGGSEIAAAVQRIVEDWVVDDAE